MGPTSNPQVEVKPKRKFSVSLLISKRRQPTTPRGISLHPVDGILPGNCHTYADIPYFRHRKTSINNGPFRNRQRRSRRQKLSGKEVTVKVVNCCLQTTSGIMITKNQQTDYVSTEAVILVMDMHTWLSSIRPALLETLRKYLLKAHVNYSLPDFCCFYGCQCQPDERC